MTPNAQTELHVRPRINRCTPKFQGSSAIAWRRKGPKPSVWQWFAGTSVGYLDDMDDWIFYAQTMAGIVWNLSDRFEIFGGARYSWFDDINVGGETYNGSDQAMGEVGLRYNF
jgi:hypothetical protein